MAVWGYFTALAAATLFGITLLLTRQVALLLAGRSHLAALAARAAEGAPPPPRWAWGNARRVFGDGPVWSWLLPVWGPPPRRRGAGAKKRS